MRAAAAETGGELRYDGDVARVTYEDDSVISCAGVQVDVYE
jgi:hypothetical protein